MAIKTYKDIQGWFDTPIFCASIIQQLSDDSPTNILEIGTWLGQSTCYLAGHAKAWGKPVTIYGVDTFKGDPTCEFQQMVVKNNGGSILDLFKKNITELGLDDYIVPVESDSHSCLDKIKVKSFTVISIDANHSYEYVKKDLEYLYPALENGGLIYGHDYNKEVKQAVDEFFGKLNKEIKNVRSNWIVVK